VFGLALAGREAEAKLMQSLVLILLLLSALMLSGCEVIGDIFQAGVWVGVILVVLVVVGVAWIAGKLRR